jgi:hypothetical protein
LCSDIAASPVARDVDELGAFVDRQRIELQVRLEEAPVRQRLGVGEHLLDRPKMRMSGHGDRSQTRCGSALCMTSIATIRCIQVVPHLEYVAMTMSSARGRYPSHRELSNTRERTAISGPRSSLGMSPPDG